MMYNRCSMPRRSKLFNCLLVPLLVLGGDAGVITTHPTSQYVPLGSNSSNFTCHGTGNVIWIINGHDVNYRSYTKERLEKQGFEFYRDMDNQKLNMTIMASISNNVTNISCKVRTDSVDISETARLIVIEVPLPPEPHLDVVTATRIVVSWETPFTWPGYEILKYNVTINDTNAGDVYSKTINATDANFTSTTTSIETIAQNCTELVFTVSALSMVGWSDPGIIIGGFPIATRNFTSPVEVEVYFESDEVLVNASFELPYMCSYQNLKYTFIIYNLTSNNHFVVGPREYSYSKGPHIFEVLNLQLVRNAGYSMAVTVHTSAGTVTSQNTTLFNATLNPTDSTNPTNSTIPPMDRAGSTLIVAVAIGAAAAAILLVTVGVAIAIVIVYIHKKQKDDQNPSVQVIQSAMVPNPIYEGPMYETIVPQNFGPLAANMESDDNQILESRYIDNPISPARSGETNTKIIPVTGNASTPTPGDDNYTVMSPIGSHTITSLMDKVEN